MKQLSLTVALLALLVQLSYAQIKKTYKDKVFAQTTVVVKQDSTKDLDILNKQFDLDEIGMDQIIRIATAPEQPVPESTAERTVSTAEADPIQLTQEQEPPAEVALSTTNVQTMDLGGQTARSYGPSGNYRTFSKYPSPKNRRFKKQKRKKYKKGKRLSCFKF